jgi:hypothetical protein
MLQLFKPLASAHSIFPNLINFNLFQLLLHPKILLLLPFIHLLEEANTTFDFILDFSVLTEINIR